VPVEGRFAELGTHERLVAAGDGHCARLFALQAAGYADLDPASRSEPERTPEVPR
jgi:hypothetical protein